jgi:hypothetical protein
MQVPDRQESDGVLLQWTHSMKLLGNVRLMRGLLLAFGVPAVLLGLLIAVVSGRLLTGLTAALVVGGLFLAIGFLVVIAMGRTTAHFRLTPEGVLHLAAGRSAGLSGVAAAGGLVAGHPGAAAGALMELRRFIKWGDIGRIEVDEPRSEILVRPVTLIKPILLHCDPESFAQVLEILNCHVSREIWENRKHRRRPFPVAAQ